MNDWTNLEVDKICRICLKENENMKHLFQECLSEKLKELATIEVRKPSFCN